MENLITIRKDEPVTSTYLISEKLGVPHTNLLRTIEKVKKQSSTQRGVFLRKFPMNFYESTFTNKMGHSFFMYELNKSAFMKVIMQLGKYEKAAEIQDEFIEGFQQMEKAILNHQNNEWVLTREQGKQIRLEMTDRVQEFIEYAKKQGAGAGADYYYANLTKATYKALGMMQHEKPKTRDMLDKMEISGLLLSEHALRKIMEIEMQKETHYKEIYLLCKQQLEKIADSILLSTETKLLQ